MSLRKGVAVVAEKLVFDEDYSFEEKDDPRTWREAEDFGPCVDVDVYWTVARDVVDAWSNYQAKRSYI